MRKDAEAQRAGAKRRRAERIERVRALKNRPCADCGGTFDPVCMDFDHRPGEAKRFNLSSVNGGGSDGGSFTWAEIVAEAAKCDVICANCHRIRTHRKRDHGQTLMKGKRPKVAVSPSEEGQLLLIADRA